MKKIVIAVLCLSILSGCTIIKENREDISDNFNLPAAEIKNQAPAYNAVLYFLNDTGEKLTAELRPITVEEGKSPAEAAIKELVSGPSEQGKKRVIGVGASLDRVEVSDEAADIYVKTGGSGLAGREMFIFGSAAANTLTDLLNISFVNVFQDGVQKAVMGRPYGPYAKFSGNIEEEWAGIVSRAGMETVPGEKKVALYFAAKDGDFILPEVRNVIFEDGNFAGAIIDELAKGPVYTYERNAALSKDTKLSDAQTIDENGSKTLVLNFSNFERTSKYGDIESEALSYASIVYSLTGFMPDIKSVRIMVNNEEVTALGNMDFSAGMKREDFKDKLGKSIKLYMLYTDSSLLAEVLRTVGESAQWSAKNRLIELFKGPKENDADTAWPIIPAGAGADDILGVKVENDMITLDLSRNFKERCKGLSAESEAVLVYGIVNTLTDISGIKRVLFIVEGERTDEIAGHLDLRSPLIKNPGLVKKNV